METNTNKQGGIFSKISSFFSALNKVGTQPEVELTEEEKLIKDIRRQLGTTPHSSILHTLSISHDFTKDFWEKASLFLTPMAILVNENLERDFDTAYDLSRYLNLKVIEKAAEQWGERNLNETAINFIATRTKGALYSFFSEKTGVSKELLEKIFTKYANTGLATSGIPLGKTSYYDRFPSSGSYYRSIINLSNHRIKYNDDFYSAEFSFSFLSFMEQHVDKRLLKTDYFIRTLGQLYLTDKIESNKSNIDFSPRLRIWDHPLYEHVYGYLDDRKRNPITFFSDNKDMTTIVLEPFTSLTEENILDILQQEELDNTNALWEYVGVRNILKTFELDLNLMQYWVFSEDLMTNLNHLGLNCNKIYGMVSEKIKNTTDSTFVNKVFDMKNIPNLFNMEEGIRYLVIELSNFGTMMAAGYWNEGVFKIADVHHDEVRQNIIHFMSDPNPISKFFAARKVIFEPMFMEVIKLNGFDLVEDFGIDEWGVWDLVLASWLKDFRGWCNDSTTCQVDGQDIYIHHHSFIQHYINELKIKGERYDSNLDAMLPKSLKVHPSLFFEENLNDYARYLHSEMAGKRITRFPDLPRLFKGLNSNWKHLGNSEALKIEGMKMKHCVNGRHYQEAAEAGDLFFHYKDGSKKGLTIHMVKHIVNDQQNDLIKELFRIVTDIDVKSAEELIKARDATLKKIDDAVIIFVDGMPMIVKYGITQVKAFSNGDPSIETMKQIEKDLNELRCSKATT